MIKYFAKPFNVVYRSENSINKKIESIENQIEFEKYKSTNNAIEVNLFTKDENKERLRKLERELDYYKEILILKDDSDYIDGILGGEIIVVGTYILGTAIGLCINRLRK